MVKQNVSQNGLLLLGKATEIKKSLHALIKSKGERTTLPQLVNSSRNPLQN